MIRFHVLLICVANASQYDMYIGLVMLPIIRLNANQRLYGYCQFHLSVFSIRLRLRDKFPILREQIIYRYEGEIIQIHNVSNIGCYIRKIQTIWQNVVIFEWVTSSFQWCCCIVWIFCRYCFCWCQMGVANHCFDQMTFVDYGRHICQNCCGTRVRLFCKPAIFKELCAPNIANGRLIVTEIHHTEWRCDCFRTRDVCTNGDGRIQRDDIESNLVMFDLLQSILGYVGRSERFNVEQDIFLDEIRRVKSDNLRIEDNSQSSNCKVLGDFNQSQVAQIQQSNSLLIFDQDVPIWEDCT